MARRTCHSASGASQHDDLRPRLRIQDVRATTAARERRVPAGVNPANDDDRAPGAGPSASDSARSSALPRARLFLALWPTPRVRSNLLAWRDAFDWPAGAAIVGPEKLHLTLHFIGPVARERIEEVAAGLAIATGSFELRFGRAELWPG